MSEHRHGASSFNLYRGTAKGAWPPPVTTGFTTPMTSRAELAGPPALYFYRVTGVSCAGLEGP